MHFCDYDLCRQTGLLHNTLHACRWSGAHKSAPAFTFPAAPRSSAGTVAEAATPEDAEGTHGDAAVATGGAAWPTAAFASTVPRFVTEASAEPSEGDVLDVDPWRRNSLARGARVTRPGAPGFSVASCMARREERREGAALARFSRDPEGVFRVGCFFAPEPLLPRTQQPHTSALDNLRGTCLSHSSEGEALGPGNGAAEPGMSGSGGAGRKRAGLAVRDDDMIVRLNPRERSESCHKRFAQDALLERSTDQDGHSTDQELQSSGEQSQRVAERRVCTHARDACAWFSEDEELEAEQRVCGAGFGARRERRCAHRAARMHAALHACTQMLRGITGVSTVCRAPCMHADSCVASGACCSRVVATSCHMHARQQGCHTACRTCGAVCSNLLLVTLAVTWTHEAMHAPFCH
jgi:hypothetical protein